jgi:predicted enzyme related to lactoylglutathione lyase
MNPSSNHVAHFAIHADDLARVQRFYAAVFGWRFEPWGPPDFFRIKTQDGDDPGLFGALQRRAQPRSPSDRAMLGYECTIAVTSVDEVARRVASAGGEVLTKRMTIPGVGHLIKLRDPEGNFLIAMQYELA